MPNYKECRFCSTKLLPEGDELICTGCRAEITKQNISDSYGGSPVIVEATVPDPVIEAMKQAVADANPEVIPLEPKVPPAPVLPPAPKSITESLIEPIAEAVEKIVEVLPEPTPQVEKDIAVIEEAVVELDKGEEALIVKEEIIAPAAPKPEEKPDAPS